MQGSFVSGQLRSSPILTHGGHICIASMQYSCVLELETMSDDDAGSTADDDSGAVPDEDPGTVPEEAGASLLDVGVSLDAGGSCLASLDAGVSLPLLVGVSTADSWFTGDTLELSSPQAVNAKAITEAAASPQTMLVIFFFMMLLLVFYQATPPQS
jgi:hypothetical protein